MASTSSCALGQGSGLFFGPASEAIAAALGLGPHPQHWEAEACALSRDEVERRLRAADLGGLTEPITRTLSALNSAAAARNARSATPTLPPDPMEDGPPTPSMARQPLSSRSSTGTGGAAPSPSRVQRFVPVVERMHGRVPRSEETWQYFEGESAVMGCLRASRLVCYNLSGTLICFRGYTDELRRVA